MSKKTITTIGCLKDGYSSSVFGHLAIHHVRATKTKQYLYYSCIRLCKKTEGCVAITFRESTWDCWLKSSVENEPKGQRSFVVMGCLETPGNELYPGYSGKVKFVHRFSGSENDYIWCC